MVLKDRLINILRILEGVLLENWYLLEYNKI